MGETVMCTKTKCKGVIKYIGVPSWAKPGKVYYGLELSKKKGTSNGTNQGVQYFETKLQYGIYVPSKGVKKGTILNNFRPQKHSIAINLFVLCDI